MRRQKEQAQVFRKLKGLAFMPTGALNNPDAGDLKPAN